MATKTEDLKTNATTAVEAKTANEALERQARELLEKKNINAEAQAVNAVALEKGDTFKIIDVVPVNSLVTDTRIPLMFKCSNGASVGVKNFQKVVNAEEDDILGTTTLEVTMYFLRHQNTTYHVDKKTIGEDTPLYEWRDNQRGAMLMEADGVTPRTYKPKTYTISIAEE